MKRCLYSRAGIERELASRADQRVLRCFGRVERMDEFRMARRMSMAEVSGGRVRGRPRLSKMDGMKVALGNRLMRVEAARQCTNDRKESIALYICNWMSFTRLFLLGPVFFGPPSSALVVKTWRGEGCRYMMWFG